MTEKLELLKKHFGYSSFREGQEALIDALLAGRDAMGIMPTGAGKSICFQIPALLLPGITLVVSPLISLMKDQVNALTQAGIPAAYFNSSLTSRQYQIAMQNAEKGKYKLIYVAPERLLTARFLEFAQHAKISLLSVDEAHCVSQWGQDFRPSYLKISEFLKALPVRPPVGAFTATATAQVREDISLLLELEDPVSVTTGFDRENLYFEVQKPADKYTALCGILKKNKDKSGIIYCATRKTVEEVCRKLCALGYGATRYHAGLSDEERQKNQEDFLFDTAPIMVATNAFGMGIDKSNVTFVVHYNMPKNMESYYQEAGRAGRDGSDAKCILLYSGQDVITNRFFIDQDSQNEEMDEKTRQAVRAKDKERLLKMSGYCHSGDCLRAYILDYFGERAPERCGHCGNCSGSFETADITADARKVLSCIWRTGERFGMKMIADILRGRRSEKVLQMHLDELVLFGGLAGESEKTVRDIIGFLVLHGYLDVLEGKYPVLKLGGNWQDVQSGEISLTMRRAKKEKEIGKKKESEGSGALFERLRTLRAKTAEMQGVPAYVVFSDATLHQMCELLPINEGAFREVPGVGEAKLKKYGVRFIKEISDFCTEGKRNESN